MLWKRSASLILSLLMAGCTLIPEVPTLPTQVRPPGIYSTSDALQAAIEDAYPLDGLTIRYKVGNPGWGGHTTLAARGDGTAEVTFADEDGQETWQANLTEAEFSALVRMLVDRQIWAVRGQREIGAPDEAYPMVIVEAEGFKALEVAMWDGEAREDPDFRAILDVLSGLASEISGGVAR